MQNKKFLSAILALLGISYPFLVYFGSEFVSFRTISLFIGMVMIGSLFFQINRYKTVGFIVQMIVASLLCLFSIFSSNDTFLFYLPVVFSMSLFVSFVYTLLYPPSIIEVFARMIIPERSPEEVEYCRRVTMMWVVFFLGNGAVAFFTACCASLAVWSLYNGFISYVLIAVLFTVELCCRHRRFRRYAGLRTDFIFKRLFPPRE